jgi:hypothetical protein
MNDEDEVCTGMDIPERDKWTAEEVKFWTQLPPPSLYCPWKDVAAFFKGTEP